MLVTPAASTSVAAAIEGAVIPEAVVGAVDGLPGRSAPEALGQDGVMETLTRVPASSPKWRLCMARRSLPFSHHREHGDNRGSQTAEHPTSRRSLCQLPNHEVESPVIHMTHPRTRCGRSTPSDRPVAHISPQWFLTNVET